MKNRNIHLVAATMLLLHCVVAAIPGWCATPQTCWAMRQDSDHYGPVRTYVCPEGVRMDTEEFIVLITPKPVYTVTVFNRESKAFLKEKITELRPLKTQVEMKKAGWKVTESKRETINGVKTISYLINKEPGKKDASVMELVTTTELGTSKGLNDACLRFMCMDEIGTGFGMPLKMFKHQKRGRKYLYFDTSEIKPTPPVAAFLSLPHDKDAHQVYTVVDLMGKESQMALPIR